MSKGADDETSEMEEGMTTSERRRRRRRGGGLRIPSDNVPRRSGATPVPEDPALAMSIAYAFSDEPSGVREVPSELGDLDDATSIARPPELAPDGSVPGAGAAPAASGPAADIPREIVDDVVPDGRTRQMAAVSLEALGLTEIEAEAEAAGNGAAPPETVDIDIDGIEDDPVDDDFEEREVVPIIRRPATIPPPLPARDELAARAEEARERARTDVVEREPDDGVVATRMPRAATVALSEDDLEELLEATPPPRRAPAAPPAAAPVAAAREVAPGVGAAVPTAPAVGTTTGEAVALAEDDLHEVAVPADASDSGEILADEIVEVEQDARAPVAPTVPVAIGPQASGPTQAAPPAPPAPPPAPPRAASAPVAKKSTASRAAASVAAAPAADPEARKKRRGKPWFEEIFDEDYLRTLPFLTPQATQAEALMAIESLGVSPGASVLDVGCGYGRHAMELAARGFHVVGVDLSLPLLLRGADEAQRRGLDINFVHADMREMDFDAQFDGAYCLFSTFGYFDDETNKKTASLIARALKPGAKFVLELLNRDYVIGDLPTRVWWEGDGCVVLEEVEFNYFSSRVQSKRSVVFDDGRQVEQEISIRVYSLHEVGKLLHAAGLRVLEVSGSMAARGRFLGNRSREIIVVAERRPPDGKPAP